MIHCGDVVANHRLCREHFRLSFRVGRFAEATPGQFVHLCPALETNGDDATGSGANAESTGGSGAGGAVPMLRRAFSIAGLRRAGGGAEIDVIYRVVGTATRWMSSLRDGDRLSVLGPLGNAFPVHPTKPIAWLVAGGVGLPPMLWFAEALAEAGKQTIAFCGARSSDLLALTLSTDDPPAQDARRPTTRCVEFARHGAGVVISTDDGSVGFHGHVGAALSAYHDANPVTSAEVAVYTCGPERMMHAVAEYCAGCDIECHVCMERAMACGTGLCQSCVVPVHDETDPDGWRYRLCCRDGPIFDARRIIWEHAPSA